MCVSLTVGAGTGPDQQLPLQAELLANSAMPNNGGLTFQFNVLSAQLQGLSHSPIAVWQGEKVSVVLVVCKCNAD